jgi:hypothetical protein
MEIKSTSDQPNAFYVNSQLMMREQGTHTIFNYK